MIPTSWIGKRVAVVFSSDRTSINGAIQSQSNLGVLIRGDGFLSTEVRRFIPWTAIDYIELDIGD